MTAPTPPTPPTPVARGDSAAEAAGVLVSGGLALIPTETFFALAADAASPAALDTIRALLRARDPQTPAGAFTWHAPDVARVLDALRPVSPLHRHALRRLLPGPFRLVVELDAPAADAARARLGVAPGLLDDAGAFGVRVPDHPVARAALAPVRTPVVCVRADGVGFGDGRTLDADAERLARDAGVRAIVRDGPAPAGRSSTTVRLTRDGGWRFEGGGVHDERAVRLRLERTILFICTGNTCRSPMAEAIARHLLEHAPPLAPGRKPVPTAVLSAGVAAGEGAPMTPEAADALRSLGIDPGRHRSRALTPETLRRADVVYAMTRSHLRALDRDRPDARADLLDPAGSDIPDPIGGPPEVYRETARRLRDLLVQRLDDLRRADDEVEGGAP